MNSYLVDVGTCAHATFKNSGATLKQLYVITFASRCVRLASTSLTIKVSSSG